MVPGVARTAANEDGAKGGYRNQARCTIRREIGSVERVAVHFADFAKPRDVYVSAYKWWKFEYSFEIAGSSEEILIAL